MDNLSSSTKKHARSAKHILHEGRKLVSHHVAITEQRIADALITIDQKKKKKNNATLTFVDDQPIEYFAYTGASAYPIGYQPATAPKPSCIDTPERSEYISDGHETESNGYRTIAEETPSAYETIVNAYQKDPVRKLRAIGEALLKMADMLEHRDEILDQAIDEFVKDYRELENSTTTTTNEVYTEATPITPPNGEISNYDGTTDSDVFMTEFFVPK